MTAFINQLLFDQWGVPKTSEFKKNRSRLFLPIPIITYCSNNRPGYEFNRYSANLHRRIARTTRNHTNTHAREHSRTLRAHTYTHARARTRTCIVSYCIVFIHFFSASHSLSLSEALPTTAIDTVSEFTRRSATGNCR